MTRALVMEINTFVEDIMMKFIIKMKLQTFFFIQDLNIEFIKDNDFEYNFMNDGLVQ